MKVELQREISGGLSPGSVVRFQEPMARHTTWRVGGPADIYLEPADEKDLAEILRFCRASGLACLVIGRGSNLLVRDGGIRGAVICLAQPSFSRMEARGDQLHCGAGVKLKNVVMEARRHRLGGLEFLEGIPGSLGGALRMNAGAMGSSLFDVVERVRYMDGEGQTAEKPASEIPVAYRSCPFFHHQIALGAVLHGQPAPIEAIDQKLATLNRRRWESQPAAPSAGCVFKNPPNIPAGKLIDELGLKGQRVGGAAVSDKHANFIITESPATARDILELIGRIQERAMTERNIQLETEVQIVGEANL